ncbi:MAG TPA: glycoside hydrolase family 76 protein [Verrucomicrobiae bacterium]|nr:glycoside hydrolase family 76 protein [Verrucomicrobiae bacterium]
MRLFGKLFFAPAITPPRNRPRHLLGRLALFCLLLASLPAFAFTAKDASTAFSSFNSVFYVQSGTNGYFKNSQTDGSAAYFWGQAEMIESVIDAYEWTTNASSQGMITNLLNGFLSNNGSSWTYNIYNDDIMWAIIAFARGGLDTGRTNYCNIAKANFDACYARAWDNTLGGGLWWTTDKNGKNACVNGPGAIAAALLFQIYGDTNYWNRATNIYNWERSVLFNAGTGAIYDAIGTNGVINYWSSTYNQGTFLGAADFLGQTNDAKLAANFTMMNMTSGGILPEYGIAGNNSGFNAIFLRWMTRFMKGRSLQSLYQPWLQLNATAAWNRRRASDNVSWCQWLQPSPAGTNFYAWDCIASFAALAAADPTQGAAPLPVPRDELGYWPMDATSGTIATNATGNGNNGTVSGAGWNANGRVNGCLSFNGSSSSVQVTNPLANDFSLAFWVKTTQTAGTPQWYNGAGLVDADVPFNANDFGTALIGGKFGFGIGNPDTTIVSAASINDGAWHHCVATRQQATGSISVYVDGNLQATGSASRNTLIAPAKLLFGATGGNYFNGSLDEVRIFSRALGSNEVAALYASSLFPPATWPTNLTATPGKAQVQLNWWEASAATRYNVKRSLVSGGPYVAITNVSSTSYADTGATSNRTYYYVVSAMNALGEGPNSAEASASPLPLVAWFKAEALTNLSSGTAVAKWTDASGNGYHALQALSANQPTLVTGAINGQSAVRFNSANSTWLWFYRPVQDDFTMIFVYQSSQGLNTGLNFWEGAGLVNGEQAGTVDDFGISLNANGQILAGAGHPDTTIHSASGLNNGQPHVVTFKRTKSTGVIALYVDSTLVAAATGGTQSLTAPNFLVLGGQGVLNNFLSGDIAEVQIYNAVLADTDRLGLEQALKCKYGLNGGATPAAPTGLTGTAGNRRITLNWLLSPGATGYQLWRSTNNGAAYDLAATNLTTSSYVDTNAANGQINYYKVTAADGCGAGAFSMVAGIVLPLPLLSLSLSANTLVLTWPDWASDWGLYTTTNLTPPVAWDPANNMVGNSNGLFTVSLPMNATPRFFRLSSP